MEKISCSVIGDLLPLYCDDLCSEDSRRIIENHLKDCPNCSGLLRKMKTECRLPDQTEPSQEEMVKNMADKWRRSVKKSFCRGVLAALLACLVLAGGYVTLTRVILIPISPDVIESTVGNVTEDSVEIFLRVKDERNVLSTSLKITDDGTCYITLKRGVIPQANGSQEAWTMEWSIARTGFTDSGARVPIREIYCGTEDSNFLIWQADGNLY